MRKRALTILGRVGGPGVGDAILKAYPAMPAALKPRARETLFGRAEWASLVGSGALTFVRVMGAVVLSTLWALPAGVVIGRSPRHRNVYFAFGHDHLGLTMAGITGKLIAELATDKPTTIDLAPFRPDRF